MGRREIVGVRIKLATPERIREISKGEVKKPETINYRTLRPEKDGLFCERIFGPTKSYECACGKYKRSGPKFRGVVCDRCGVLVVDNRVRRERMGHIELACPVVHIWYLRGIPSRLSLLLGTNSKDLEKVVYFAPTRKKEVAFKVVSDGRRPDLVRRGALIAESEMIIHAHYDPKLRYEEAYVVESVDNVPVDEGDILTATQVRQRSENYGSDAFRAEPAYEVLRDTDDLKAGDNISETDMRAHIDKSDGDLTADDFRRAHVSNNEAFIVTTVFKLPFSKGGTLSKSELELYQQKYPGRFSATRGVLTIEDPCFLVIEPGASPFARAEVVYDRQQYLCRAYDKKFEAGIGAESVQTMLDRIDCDTLAATLREEVAESSGQKKRKLIKRLQVAEEFRKSASSAKSMIMSVLPVIPPDLRPLVQLDGGRFATSDLNDLYRRVINRNNRLKKLQELRAPEIIIRNEKRMLQESVDALIDNGRMGKAVLGAGNRPLKSLTDLLKGKKGRFRQNLLGKRVDYSGRSVIVIGPTLKIYQCGLPKQMALELFKPFVIRQLVERNMAPNVKSAKRQIERGREEIWGILEEIIKDHPVMLNRAPTLHRLGIQAFEPVLMEGKAIRLHPMVCTAFNADFDGDQMAVHVPLSLEAQAEARLLMLSANNLLSPASGRPVVTPTQDIVLGIYYLTDMRPGLPGDGMYFNSVEEVLSAFDHGIAHVNASVWLKVDNDWQVSPEGRRRFGNASGNPSTINNSKRVPKDTTVFVETSPGRALFNSVVDPKLRYINERLDKSSVGRLIDEAYDKIERTALVDMLDAIKSLGYHWAAKSGISFGMGNIVIPPEKEEITAHTIEEDSFFKERYEMGELTRDEYFFQKDKLWSEAKRKIEDSIVDRMEEQNPIRMMVDSGARGNRGQMGQMAGIRGLMSDPSGRIIDYPITANFREGMNMLEYFISTHGARKGLADTALRTAKSGYLTRRLVDVAQDLIITEEDCGTDKGLLIGALIVEGKPMIPLSERIAGRTALYDIKVNRRIVVKAGDMITQAKAEEIERNGVTEVWVRSPLSCATKQGLCRKCYGMDLSSRRPVPIGEAVGVVAAQSIGEPGTQLTMRTFHTGGVRLTGEDITQGLPRIEQLFEARRPKKVAYLAGIDGVVEEIRVSEGKRKVIISTPDGMEKITHAIPASQELKEEIVEGMEVERTTHLTEGNIDPQQLLDVSGIDAVQHVLVDEIQEVYRSQGVSINNKHIEVILRKVAPLNRLKVIEEGDTSFVAGDMVWMGDLDVENAAIKADNERSVAEAVKVFSGDVLKKIEKASEETKDLVGRPLNEAALWLLLKPGMAVSEFVVEHLGKQDVEVVVGEAAFRKQIDGLELVNPIQPGDVTTGGFATGGFQFDRGEKLTMPHLRQITSNAPFPIVVRNVDIMERSVGVDWLAEALAERVNEDGVAVEKVLVGADTMINKHIVDLIREKDIREIKVWRDIERIGVVDAFQKALMNNDTLWGKLVTKAVDKNNDEVSVPRYVDARTVRKLADGSVAAIAISSGGSESIVTRSELMKEFLSTRMRGKVLLGMGFADRTEPLGRKVDDSVIDDLVEREPLEIFARATSAKTDLRRLIRTVTFVRKLRENPDCRPFIHGITKAALATESFLSAASFQQTAQVLAGAAVKGQIDPLHGLKENVIIGHLVPAGTGSETSRSTEEKE
ncbi:MAG: DNA-directed RNA polymerase subunit beta' [Synergistaceae bacterium]|jgi:DNA-directed RNA polymerase subunit beta'|nr:DNA-directed RNA polymerase subunit beta' [Synergistaceae bacterium]